MDIKYIKRALIVLSTITFIVSENTVYAQTAKTNYFIESSYTRSSLNPAFRPNNSYIGVPFLTGIAADYKTNTFNLDNFTHKVNGERVTFMHSSISAEEFLSNLSDKNYVSSEIGYDIFSMGFFKKDAFWNINLSVRGHVDANVPKSLFNLVKTGFSQEELTKYHIKNTSATANAHIELGVSYSRPLLNNSLTLGLRTKLLGGIANFDLNAESLDIAADSKEWIASSKVTLNGSAPNIRPKYKTKAKDNGSDLELIDGFDFGSWGKLSGIGLGFDIGAVYDFNDIASGTILDNLKASVSFTDIGFISWSKNNTTHLASSGEEVTLTPKDYTIHTDGSTSLEDIYDDVLDDLKEAVNLKETKTGGRTTSLRTTMNTGLEYSFLDNKLSAGLLYSIRFGNYFNTQEVTLSANYRPKKWLATSLSYSFQHSDFKTFGWAIYLTPSKGVNFFLASDYIIPRVSPQWIPSTSKALNVQLGFSIPM